MPVVAVVVNEPVGKTVVELAPVGNGTLAVVVVVVCECVTVTGTVVVE